MFRIRDILVRVRMWMRIFGSLPMTIGYGFGSGLRIMLCSPVTFKVFMLIHLEGSSRYLTFTSFFKDKNSTVCAGLVGAAAECEGKYCKKHLCHGGIAVWKCHPSHGRVRWA